MMREDKAAQIEIEKDDQARCSFCGKSPDACGKLASSPHLVRICHDCVDTCHALLVEESSKALDYRKVFRLVLRQFPHNPTTDIQLEEIKCDECENWKILVSLPDGTQRKFRAFIVSHTGHIQPDPQREAELAELAEYQ